MIQNTLANVLIDNKGDGLPFGAAVYETHIDNLDLAASHIRIARLEKSGQFDDLFRLKDALNSLSAEYDFVLIDCPPSLGVVVTQALLASDYVLIPVAAEYYAFEGTQDLEETIKSVRRSNPALKILGYVVTRFDARTTASADAYTQAQAMFDDKLFETLIRSNTHLIAAPAYRQSIFEYAQASRGSEDYMNLTKEFLTRMEVSSKVRVLKEKRR
jgi:chromosome partitioning protein